MTHHTLYSIQHTIRMLSRKAILTLLALIVLGVPLVYLSFLNSKTASAWFDENWLYRAAVPISAHTNAETNVFITVTIDTATPITAGKMQSDCGDLRFTKENGEILPYFINASPGCNNASTTIQVNFDSFPAGAQTIYYYYGNGSAIDGFSGGAFATAATGETIGTVGSETQGKGPVGYWSFDDGQGTIAQDKSSSNNDGTLSGTTKPTWQIEDQCISGKCLFFDGSTSYVSANDASSLDATKVTVQAWIRPNTLNAYNAVASKRGAYGMLITSTGDIYFSIITAGGTEAASTSSIDVTANKWYFVTATYDGTTMKTYVNGALAESNTHTFGGNISASALKVFIGANDGDGGDVADEYWFNGFIDDVKIYNYARSAAEIKADYLSGAKNAAARGGTSAVLGSSPNQWLSDGLIAYWKMDEASWSGGAGEVTDSSGNGITGSSACTGGGCTIHSNAAAKFGNGANLNGTSDYVNFSGTNLFNVQQGSVAAWFKASAGGYLWNSADEGSNETYIRVTVGSDGVSFKQRENSVTSGLVSGNATVNYADNAWHHVVMASTGTEYKIYVDGEPATVTVGAGGSNNGDWFADTGVTLPRDSFVIGAIKRQTVDNTTLLTGKVDEFRVYNRVLTPKEVKDLYNFAPGPVGYWDFENGSGTSVTDKSGYSNTGTWNGTGATHWTQGKYGKAGNFNDTTDDYVSISNSSSLTLSTNFTFSAWVKRAATGVTDELYESGQSGTNHWGVQISSDKIDFVEDDVANNNSNSTIDTNWHYITVVKSGDTGANVTFYLDGKADGTATVGTVTSPSGTITLGAFDGSTAVLGGQMDEVKIYNYARTQKQIVSDMNAGHPAVGSPVGSAIGYWKFDEGADNMCSGGTNDACNSGNGGSTLDGAGSGFASPATSTSGWTQSGKFNKALNFDGSGDYVTFSGINGLGSFVNNGSFSVSVWAQTSSANTRQAIMGDWDSSGSLQSFSIEFGGYEMPSDHITFGWRDSTGAVNSYVDSNFTYAANTWYHITATFDDTSKTRTIYINGAKKNSDTVSGTMANGVTLALGRAGAYDGSYLSGRLDEVKIYNYALTPNEILTEFNRGSSLLMGSLGNNSSYAVGAANQEYCIPGDSTACTAPIGRWDFEEKTGQTTYDTSGNGFSSTLGADTNVGSDDPSWTTGKVGGALNFDGGDFIKTSASATLVPSTGTIEMWLNIPSQPAATNYYTFASTAPAAENSGWKFEYFEDTGVYKLSLRKWTPQAYANLTYTLPLNSWFHLSVTWDGSNARYYLNGSLIGTVAQGSPTSASLAAYFGGDSRSSGAGSNLKGKMDKARIFDYVRTPAQIAYDYNRGAPIAHWKFDECQGTTAYDSSGNGNSGTITPGSGGQTAVGTCTGSAGTLWKDGVSGKRNYSLDLDGTDDYIHLGTDLYETQDAGTIAAWIYFGGTGNYAIFDSSQSDSATNSMKFFVNANNLSFQHYIGSGANNNAIRVNTTLNANQWYHVAVTSDGSTWKLYINGVNQTLTIDAGSNNGRWFNDLAAGTHQVDIGRFIRTGETFYYQGQIDDVRLYNYALTAAQVKDIMNDGAVRFGPSIGAP